MRKTSKTAVMCECGILVAIALALSYLEIPLGFSLGGFGGSISFAMVPIIIIALRRGAAWGIGSGFVFGTLKYFFAQGAAISWVSIIFDYSVAYAAVGAAGFFKGKNAVLGAAIGCAARFLVHFISGVTVYAQYMPEEFLNLKMSTPVVYSALYNGTYMLFNTIAAVIVVPLLMIALKRANLEPNN